MAKQEDVEVGVGDANVLGAYDDGVPGALALRGRLLGSGGSRRREGSKEATERLVEEKLSETSHHVRLELRVDHRTLIGARVGDVGAYSKTARTLMTLEFMPGQLEFSFIHTLDTAYTVHTKLKDPCREWVRAQGFEEREAREIWVATWEAIQNAIKHGSDRGDAIYGRLYAAGPGLIRVQLKQPKAWADCDTEFGNQRMVAVASIDNPTEETFGGAATILKLCAGVSFSGCGRELTMRFRQGARAKA